MLARRQILQISTLALLLGGLLGCGNMPKLGGVKTTPIGDVKNSWQKYSTVYIKGQVGRQVPFIGSGAYELEDPTGTVWVLTRDDLPSSGDTILLKGQVKYQSIPIAGKELGEVYIEAQKQLERVSSQEP